MQLIGRNATSKDKNPKLAQKDLNRSGKSNGYYVATVDITCVKVTRILYFVCTLSPKASSR